MSEQEATARVVAVHDDVITLESAGSGSQALPLVKNEVVYICPEATGEEEKLKAEVLRVRGRRADVQVYEDTTGVAIGDPVEQTGELLSVELGPGLLRQVYDGLQNPLHRLGDQGRQVPAARVRGPGTRSHREVELRRTGPGGRRGASR